MITERPSNDRRRVIIVGAGLGGLACAMAMHYQGFEVLIFERVREFLRLGDSLGLGENALKLLKRWGLHDQLIEIGNKSADMHIRRWNDGRILATQPLMVWNLYESTFLARLAKKQTKVNGKFRANEI
jgi:salicylate hydroxylase